MARCAEFSAGLWLRCANNFAPLSLQRTNLWQSFTTKSTTGSLPIFTANFQMNEQRQLHTHLVDCVACRKTHQETKTMNKILEETLAQQKPDPSFEQRMLAGFRNRVPERTGLLKLLADLMRMRAAQVTAVAAVLLGLVQLGRMITGETATPPAARDRYANEQLFEQPSQVAATSEPGRAGALDKADELAAGKPKDLALAPPQSAVETRSKLERDFKALPATVPPAKAAEAEMAAQGNRAARR